MQPHKRNLPPNNMELWRSTRTPDFFKFNTQTIEVGHHLYFNRDTPTYIPNYIYYKGPVVHYSISKFNEPICLIGTEFLGLVIICFVEELVKGKSCVRVPNPGKLKRDREEFVPRNYMFLLRESSLKFKILCCHSSNFPLELILCW